MNTRLLFSLLVLAALAGPGYGEELAVTPNGQAAATTRNVAAEPLPILRSNSPAGQFNAKVIFLADQLERNMDRWSADGTYIVTTFSPLDKLSETTGFGRLLAENLTHELQVRKWQVYDVRLTKDIIVTEAGEFILSRDIKKIRDSYQVNGVVTGTYAVNGDSIIVNVRVIDLDTGIVTGSGQVHLPHNGFTGNLLQNTDKRGMVKIIGGP